MKWEEYAHDYQKKARSFVLENPYAGLLLDPGLGKTSIMLSALSKMKKTALIVAPLRVVYSVWPEEAIKWAEFGGLRVEVLHGRYKKQRAHTEADLYLVNPEGVEWLLGEWSAYHEDEWPDVLIIDESTKFRNTQTRRFKALKPYLPLFDRRYILTGTPSPNGLLDLFGQMYLLDLGASLGRYITHYKNKYFYPSGFGGYDWKPFPGSEDAIYDSIRPYVMRLAAEDYLKMPKLLTSDIVVELPEKAVKLYDDLQRDLVVRLREGDLTASNAGSLTMKARQISNGFVYLDDKAVSHVHSEKVNALTDLIESLQGQPLLVAYAFRNEAEYLAKHLKAPVIGGGTSAKKARSLIEEWNLGTLPVLLIHPASAGHGLNLQAQRHLAWFGPTWDLEHYDQTVRRLWRQGQKQTVHVYHLVTKGTIDGTIFNTLKSKSRSQASMFEALKRDLLGE